jgi:hypothetical protein
MAVTTEKLAKRNEKEMHEQAQRKVEALFAGLENDYGAIIPSRSDGNAIGIADFKSHKPFMFRLSNIPSQIEANAILNDIKTRLGTAMLEYDPNSRGIEAFSIIKEKDFYDPRQKTAAFSIVLLLDEAALGQFWQARRLAQK